MMKAAGVLLKCDRCGEEAFIRDEDNSGIPAGWRFDIEADRDFKIDLCPRCTREWREMIKKFMERGPAKVKNEL